MSLSGRQRRFRVLLWILLLLNMAAIFAFSARTGSESTRTSDAILAAPKEAYEAAHPEKANDERVYWWFQFIVRKGAHVLEFAALAVWATGLLVLYRARFFVLFGAGFAALYALSDELHQSLVPGRDCRITDWLIDCLGALLGAAFVWLVYRRCKRRRLRGKGNAAERDA